MRAQRNEKPFNLRVPACEASCLIGVDDIRCSLHDEAKIRKVVQNHLQLTAFSLSRLDIRCLRIPVADLPQDGLHVLTQVGDIELEVFDVGFESSDLSLHPSASLDTGAAEYRRAAGYSPREFRPEELKFRKLFLRRSSARTAANIRRRQRHRRSRCVFL